LKNTTPPKSWNILSAAVLLVLLVLAASYWRERAWLLDVAFQTVLMIKDGTVQVQVDRFGAAVVQALPLLGIKLGLPLPWISWLYSVAFPLVYLLFFGLIVGVFRQWQLGLALALLYTTMTYDGFYWCTSELQQGLGFLLVIWAGILHRPALNQPVHWLVLVPALVALVFYHPLVFVPFVFCWAYLGWQERNLQHRRYLLLLGLLLFLVWAKGHWFPNYYDTAKIATFRENLQTYFPNYFSFPAYAKFLHHSLRYWWGFPLLLAAVTAGLAYRRQWLPLLMVWGACTGLVVLNALGSPNATYRFYSEVNYYPLVIFVAIPVVCTLLPHWQKARWLLPAAVVFFALRLGLIALHHTPYTQRWQYLARTLHAQQNAVGGQRFLAAESQVAMDTLVMSWGTPFETLLLSAAAGPTHAATLLVTPEVQSFSPEQRQDTTRFLSPFQDLSLPALQGRYFRLAPGAYREIAPGVH